MNWLPIMGIQEIRRQMADLLLKKENALFGDLDRMEYQIQYIRKNHLVQQSNEEEKPVTFVPYRASGRRF